jgi:hypothetical protein
VQDHVNQFDVETSIKRMVVPEKVLQVSRHSKTDLEPHRPTWTAERNGGQQAQYAQPDRML